MKELESWKNTSMVVNPHRTDPEPALEDFLPREITAHHHLINHEAIHLMAILHANSHQLTHKHEVPTPAMQVRDTKTDLNMTPSLKTNPVTSHHTRVRVSIGPITGTSLRVGV